MIFHDVVVVVFSLEHRNFLIFDKEQPYHVQIVTVAKQEYIPV